VTLADLGIYKGGEGHGVSDVYSAEVKHFIEAELWVQCDTEPIGRLQVQFAALNV